MYRAVALLGMRKGISLDDPAGFVNEARQRVNATASGHVLFLAGSDFQ